ncbi:YuzF family protein [Virgibacillus sp. W0430]|uniref:YuzF family protein n=1 Tax=Virgibacillus sp. W0430 TaxID=3391580 RepID=UPI003F47A353
MYANTQSHIQMTSHICPYFYQTLSNLSGKNIVVQTTQNPIQGILKAVTPDHIVIEKENTPFYIRNQAIVWVSPM